MPAVYKILVNSTNALPGGDWEEGTYKVSLQLGIDHSQIDELDWYVAVESFVWDSPFNGFPFVVYCPSIPFKSNFFNTNFNTQDPILLLANQSTYLKDINFNSVSSRISDPSALSTSLIEIIVSGANGISLSDNTSFMNTIGSNQPGWSMMLVIYGVEKQKK